MIFVRSLLDCLFEKAQIRKKYIFLNIFIRQENASFDKSSLPKKWRITNEARESDAGREAKTIRTKNTLDFPQKQTHGNQKGSSNKTTSLYKVCLRDLSRLLPSLFFHEATSKWEQEKSWCIWKVHEEVFFPWQISLSESNHATEKYQGSLWPTLPIKTAFSLSIGAKDSVAFRKILVKFKGPHQSLRLNF